MSPDDYIVGIKERFGEQRSKDGQLIRDMNDQDLMRRMFQRYPGDREKVIGYEAYLGDNVPPEVPKTEVQKKLNDISAAWTPSPSLNKYPGQPLKNLRSNVAESGVLPLVGGVAGGFAGGAAGALAGGVGAIPGAIAGATVGAAGGEALSEGLNPEEDLDAGKIAKTGATYGALEAVGGPVAAGIGKFVLKPLGETIAKAVIPTSAREAQSLQIYKANNSFVDRMKGLLSGTEKAPKTAGQTGFDKGFVGTESMIGVQARQAKQKLWGDVIGPALKAAPEKVDMPAFFADLEKDIVTKTPELSRQKELLNALQALKEDYKDAGQVSLETLQKYKEGWAKFIPDKAYMGKPISGAFKDVTNMAAGKARGAIYEVVGPEVKKAYLDYGNLQGLMELGQKATAGTKLKGGAGSFVHALYEMTAVPTGTIGGQTLYKLGNGMEIIGAPGARTLREVLGIPLSSGEESEE